MSRYYSDDPVMDFHRYDMEQARREARLPVCEGSKCGKKISDDDYYYVEGMILCEECLKSLFRRSVEDYIEI